MDSYTLYKYIHLTGLVFWLGGLFSLSSFVRFISKQNDEYREKLAEYAYRIYYASNFIGLLLVIGSGLLLSGCIKDDNFDTVPTIEFEAFELHYNNLSEIDSATYSFSFKDGDGDIGSVDSVDFNCFLTIREECTKNK